MNCVDKIQCTPFTRLRLLVSLSAVILLAACSPAPAPVTEAAPAVDLYKLEAEASQALGLAQINGKRIDTLSLRLDTLSLRLSRTDSAIAALPYARTEEALDQLAMVREDVQFLRAYLENQRKVPAIVPAKKLPPEVASPAPAAYTKAMSLYDTGDYLTAAGLFESVPSQKDSSSWNDDAWYWAGESALRLGDFSRAIAAFQKVLTYNPSDKLDDAQFGIGLCYVKLGDRDRAIAELRKVAVHYPDSDRVAQANAELEKLQSR